MFAYCMLSVLSFVNYHIVKLKNIKMTIQFYLNNETETEIFTMYEMVSNPFKKDDIIHLSVSELPPNAYDEFKKEFQLKMQEQNNEKQKLFKQKSVKLTKEDKYFDITDDKLIIEYHCDFV